MDKALKLCDILNLEDFTVATIILEQANWDLEVLPSRYRKHYRQCSRSVSKLTHLHHHLLKHHTRNTFLMTTTKSPKNTSTKNMKKSSKKKKILITRSRCSKTSTSPSLSTKQPQRHLISWKKSYHMIDFSRKVTPNIVMSISSILWEIQSYSARRS